MPKAKTRMVQQPLPAVSQAEQRQPDPLPPRERVRAVHVLAGPGATHLQEWTGGALLCGVGGVVDYSTKPSGKICQACRIEASKRRAELVR